jgi:hypothetical protein
MVHPLVILRSNHFACRKKHETGIFCPLNIYVRDIFFVLAVCNNLSNMQLQGQVQSSWKRKERDA